MTTEEEKEKETEYRSVKISSKELGLMEFLIHHTMIDQSYLESLGIPSNILVTKWLDELDRIRKRMLSEYYDGLI